MERLALLIVWIAVVIAKEVSVRVTEDLALKLQVNEVVSLQPFPELSLTSMRVKQLTDSSSTYSSLCRFQPADITTQLESLVVFQEYNGSKASRMIFQFEQLKNLKNVIDLAKFKQYYFVVFKEGLVEVYNTNPAQTLERIRVINHGKKLSEGELITDGNILLYVSQTEMFQVNETNLLIVANYHPNPLFLFSLLYPEGELFIALEKGGVNYHRYNHLEGILSNKTYLDLQNILGFGVEIEDMAYDPESSLLMILDFSKGVFCLDFTNDSLILNTQHQVQRRGCENMVYRDKTIYLTCPNLVKYSLQNKSLVERAVAMYPESLIVNNNSIVLVGGSHINLYTSWESSPIDKEILQPTKLLFEGSKMVYMNDYELLEVTLTPVPSSLICSSQNFEVGHYILLISSTAPCNTTYLTQQAINVYDLDPEDTCTYDRQINLEIWQPQNIRWVYIVVGCSILLISILGFLCWCCFRNYRLKQDYEELVETQASENEMEVRTSDEVTTAKSVTEPK